MKIYTFILLIFVFACAKTQIGETANIRNVSATEFRSLIEQGGGQLVDIRTPGEFQQGHIEGARLIDFYAPDYRHNLDQLDKNLPVYIYCRSGNRTSQSLGLLQELGFSEIVNLKHGLIDWTGSGFSLITG